MTQFLQEKNHTRKRKRERDGKSKDKSTNCTLKISNIQKKKNVCMTQSGKCKHSLGFAAIKELLLIFKA